MTGSTEPGAIPGRTDRFGAEVDPLPCECDWAVGLQSALLTNLHDRWAGLCAAGMLPGRRDFDPLALREFLGWLFLLEADPVADDFRYTLIGTGITAQVGVDNTGRLVGEVFGPAGVAMYRTVRDRARPVRVFGLVGWRDQRHKSFETLILPLADDGRTVTRVIGAMVFGPAV
jgi:hypothetical protein